MKLTRGNIAMKKTRKLITALTVLFVAAALAACSAAGDLKGFLAKAEGDWYFYGNSADALVRVYEDGKWEYYAPKSENGGLRLEWGRVTYDSDNKSYMLTDENGGVSYTCELKDGLMSFKSGTLVAAEESRDLAERFDGEWYPDADENADHYEFTNGRWKFWKGSGSSDSGILMYRGGDRKTLTCIDPYADEPFAIFTVEDTDKLMSGGKTYVRAEAPKAPESPATDIALAEEHSISDEENAKDGGDSFEDAVITTGVFYYLHSDSELESLYFISGNTVDIDSPGEDTVEGTYSVSGDILTITIDGEDYEFIIRTEQGVQILEDAWGDQYWSNTENDDDSFEETVITTYTFYYRDGNRNELRRQSGRNIQILRIHNL